MALGMGTRNIAAVFAVLMAIPNPDTRLLVLVVLVVPLSAIMAFCGAIVRRLGRRKRHVISRILRRFWAM